MVLGCVTVSPVGFAASVTSMLSVLDSPVVVPSPVSLTLIPLAAVTPEIAILPPVTSFQVLPSTQYFIVLLLFEILSVPESLPLAVKLAIGSSARGIL